MICSCIPIFFDFVPSLNKIGPYMSEIWLRTDAQMEETQSRSPRFRLSQTWMNNLIKYIPAHYPCKGMEVWQFVGFAQNLQQFKKGFTKTPGPLHFLMAKFQTLCLTQLAFGALKEYLPFHRSTKHSTRRQHLTTGDKEQCWDKGMHKGMSGSGHTPGIALCGRKNTTTLWHRKTM